MGGFSEGFQRLCFLFIVRLAALACFFFFNDAAPPEIYPLPLHAALPIYRLRERRCVVWCPAPAGRRGRESSFPELALQRFLDAGINEWGHVPAEARHLPYQAGAHRSEEHTSELQSRLHLVCRLLLAKKEQRPARPVPKDGERLRYRRGARRPHGEKEVHPSHHEAQGPQSAHSAKASAAPILAHQVQT